MRNENCFHKLESSISQVTGTVKNVIPGTGCSPGSGLLLGLYGIICEKSGRGRVGIDSTLSDEREFEDEAFLEIFDMST